MTYCFHYGDCWEKMLSLPVAQKPLLGIGGGKKYFLPLANASLRLLLFDSRCSTALSTN
jgi:hypothetical protein